MRLPDKKRPGNPVLASDWNLLLDAIAARTPHPSPGLELVQSSGGFAFRVRRVAAGDSGSAPTACRAFYATEVREVSDVPHLFLVTGQVTGGTGSEAYDVDLCAVGSEPEDGTCVWLEITGDGYVEDGVLLPGFDVTGVTHGSGSSMPDQVPPTVEDDTGAKAYVLLGSWNGGAFTAAACGNVNVTFCPGSFSFSRF